MKINTLLSNILHVTGAIGVVIAAILGVAQLIDLRVDARLKNSQVKEEVLKEVNRYLLFNGKGTVISDPNKIFDDWIESITVEPRRDYGEAPQVFIKIKFKKYIQIEPLLHSYGTGARAVGEQVSSLEWKFDVINGLSAGPDVPLDTKEARFLLQIFR